MLTQFWSVRVCVTATNWAFGFEMACVWVIIVFFYVNQIVAWINMAIQGLIAWISLIAYRALRSILLEYAEKWVLLFLARTDTQTIFQNVILIKVYQIAQIDMGLWHRLLKLGRHELIRFWYFITQIAARRSSFYIWWYGYRTWICFWFQLAIFIFQFLNLFLDFC